jgi:cytosine/adenosine deaminase-related metal-dependent hydrolase
MTDATRTIDCSHVISPKGPLGAQTIAIKDGAIASVTPSKSAAAEKLLAMPALVNAHDHGRAVRTSSIGADAMPLESWINYIGLFPAVDPYLAAAMSYANSALGGAGTVMNHYTRAQGLTDLPTEVAEVARAARDVGIRAGFAVSMKDRNPLVYGDAGPLLAALPADARREIEARLLKPPLSPQDYIKLVDDVAAAADSPHFNVQYGPNGVQWCSDELLQAIAKASEHTGRRIHMHLLETKYQRAWADETYPHGVVRMLDNIGLLSPRLTLAHCTWANQYELDLLAERGVTISVNTSSNLHLHSGVAPVPQMHKSICKVAMGIDSKALDDDDDALRELRLSYLLHAGTGFDLQTTRLQALQQAVGNGRFAVTNVNDGGRIEAGAAADLLLLDWAALDNDGLRDDLDPLHVLYSRATRAHIRELIVGGRSIVTDGRALGIDLPAVRAEVLDKMRAGMAANAGMIAALAALQPGVTRYYLDMPCC